MEKNIQHITSSSMGMQDCKIPNILVSSFLPILHYDAAPFRSNDTWILKVEMISFKRRSFSSFRMSGVCISLFRAYLNSIYVLMESCQIWRIAHKGMVSLKRYNFLRINNRKQLFIFSQS